MTSQSLRAGGFLGPEFNSFLFASIGTDARGRPLSVVSALARLDLDAWAEAAKWARLPRDRAAADLTLVIRKFTEIKLTSRETERLAAGLVALLPERTSPLDVPVPSTMPKNLARFMVCGVLTLLLLITVHMGMSAQAPAPHQPAPASHTATPP
jgi:hypothetical protein